MSKVLIYGSTGGQGRAITEAAIASGHQVRVMVRSASSAEKLRGLDVEPVIGDLEDVDTLIQATRGIDDVVMTLPLQFDAGLMYRQGKAVIDAAAHVGVQTLVYNASIAVPDHKVGYPFFDDGMLQVIRYGTESIAPMVTLRPPLYVDNLLAPWTVADIQNESVIRYAVPAARRIHWSSFTNQAEFVMATLGRRDLSGEVFDIAWPEPMTGTEIAQRISKAIGRTVTYEGIEPHELGNRCRPYWGDGAAEHVESLYRLIDANDGKLLDRDYGHAAQVLAPELSSVQAWADRQFGTPEATQGKPVATSA